ncbi:MAG: class I SAM-dependent methyltransferase [Clostridia bacterium]
MDKIKLPNRLQIIADNIKPNRRICDVGTDHAYLPIHLILSKKCTFAIACDIVNGPLEKAKANVLQYGLENDIKIVLSDGLLNVKREDFDDVVIAGMGGELIAKIIDNASFLQDSSVTLYLQPMTKSEKLRRYLSLNNFYITNEFIAKDKDKLFEIIIAKYGNSCFLTNGECVCNKIIKDKTDENSILFLNRLIKKYELIHKGRPNDKKFLEVLNYLKGEE